MYSVRLRLPLPPVPYNDCLSYLKTLSSGIQIKCIKRLAKVVNKQRIPRFIIHHYKIVYYRHTHFKKVYRPKCCKTWFVECFRADTVF